MNPRSPIAAGDRFRFVVFGGSIASDWNNPVATSARAVLSAIADLGHDVTFLEQRGNPFLTELLAARGSRPLKAFTDRYPNIQFRTYDLPSGWQRIVWFGREIATADAVMALPGIPDPLLPEISALTSPRLIRLVDESLAVESVDIKLVRVEDGSTETRLAFGPAVVPMDSAEVPRDGRPLLVAYDDAEEAESFRESYVDRDLELIQSGTAVLPGWRYAPEVDLPEFYTKHRTAIVCGAGDTPWADARRLLPVASDCASIDPGSVESTAIVEGQQAPTLPAQYEARTQAELIVSAVGRLLGR